MKAQLQLPEGERRAVSTTWCGAGVGGGTSQILATLLHCTSVPGHSGPAQCCAEHQQALRTLRWADCPQGTYWKSRMSSWEKRIKQRPS